MQRDKTRKMRTVNRTELISRIAKEGDYYRNSVADFLNVIEETVGNILMETSEEEDVTIRLMDGFAITNCYIPEHEMEHPASRKKIIIKPKTRSSARITVPYREKMRERWDREHNKKK